MMIFWYNFIFFPNGKKFSGHVEKWFYFVKVRKQCADVMTDRFYIRFDTCVFSNNAIIVLCVVLKVLFMCYLYFSFISENWIVDWSKKRRFGFFFKKTGACNCTDYSCAGPYNVITCITTLCAAITTSFWCYKDLDYKWSKKNQLYPKLTLISDF